jgi:hypothetical protein
MTERVGMCGATHNRFHRGTIPSPTLSDQEAQDKWPSI